MNPRGFSPGLKRQGSRMVELYVRFLTYRAFQKHLYNGIPNVIVWEHLEYHCKALLETLLYRWKSHWTATIPGKTPCVLLHYDSSKHCTRHLNNFIQAYKVVKLFLKHPVLHLLGIGFNLLSTGTALSFTSQLRRLPPPQDACVYYLLPLIFTFQKLPHSNSCSISP
jgi:hypothetical protein